MGGGVISIVYAKRLESPNDQQQRREKAWLGAGNINRIEWLLSRFVAFLPSPLPLRATPPHVVV